MRTRRFRFCTGTRDLVRHHWLCEKRRLDRDRFECWVSRLVDEPLQFTAKSQSMSARQYRNGGRLPDEVGGFIYWHHDTDWDYRCTECQCCQDGSPPAYLAVGLISGSPLGDSPATARLTRRLEAASGATRIVRTAFGDSAKHQSEAGCLVLRPGADRVEQEAGCTRA